MQSNLSESKLILYVSVLAHDGIGRLFFLLFFIFKSYFIIIIVIILFLKKDKGLRHLQIRF